MNKFHDLWVRDFIINFKKDSGDESAVNDLFERGYCYHFSIILENLFNGTVMYNSVDNHFATKIYVETSWYANHEEMEYRLYDITGRIDLTDDWVEWEQFCKEEPLEANSIEAQCIYKI